MSIRDTVKEALLKQGRTQIWLSNETGIPASHLSEFLNGTRSIKLEKLEKIAKALGKKWNLVEDVIMNPKNPNNTALVAIPGKKRNIQLRRTLFWDVDVFSLTAERNQKLIIERVFTRGTIDEFKQVINYYGLKTISRIVVLIGYLDNKNLNFLSQVLDIPKSEFLCYEKKQSITLHWS